MTRAEPIRNSRMASEFSLIWKQRTQHKHIADFYIQTKEANASRLFRLPHQKVGKDTPQTGKVKP